MAFVSEMWFCITQRAVTVVRCIHASVLFLSDFVSPTYFQPIEIIEATVTRHGRACENIANQRRDAQIQSSINNNLIPDVCC